MRFVLAWVAVLRQVVFEVGLALVDVFEDDQDFAAGFEVASTSGDAWRIASDFTIG